MYVETPSNTELHHALGGDHARLNQLFDRLVECVRADDRAEVLATWTDFEHALLAHLDWEEMYLLPAYERRNATDAAAIRADHARFRALLAELGIGLELHAVRAESIEEFVRLLRSHAAHEERAFYPWAGGSAEPTATRSMLRRLREAWRFPTQRRT